MPNTSIAPCRGQPLRSHEGREAVSAATCDGAPMVWKSSATQAWP